LRAKDQIISENKSRAEALDQSNLKVEEDLRNMEKLRDKNIELEDENQDLREQCAQSKSLLPNSDEDVLKVQELAKESPEHVFERMREITAELMFLTQVIDDQTLDENPQALEVLAEDYTELFGLVTSRGLLLEEID